MNAKHGLGRGLGALLSPSPAPSPAPESPASNVQELPIGSIVANPRQPRKVFDDNTLRDLAQSLKRSGVLQPVVVRRHGQQFQIVVGERRWRAAGMAGLSHISAVVREATDAESLELALVENLLREDLNPMEEAEAYQQILGEFGWTQEQLAQRVGRDRSTIANSLRLLKLPLSIQDDLRANRLMMGHARALLALTSLADQMKLRDDILSQSWSVRATEEGVQKQRATPLARRSAELSALEESLQRALLTRVRIVGNERRGRVEIAYATTDELNRLAAALGAQS